MIIKFEGDAFAAHAISAVCHDAYNVYVYVYGSECEFGYTFKNEAQAKDKKNFLIDQWEKALKGAQYETQPETT